MPKKEVAKEVKPKKKTGPKKAEKVKEELKKTEEKEDINFDKFQNYLETLGLTKVLIVSLLIGLIVGGAFAYNFVPKNNEQQIPIASQKEILSIDSDVPAQTISKDELKETIKKYIFANNMVMPGSSVEINKMTEEGGLYKLDIAIAFQGQTQNVESYATKDGKFFFPSALNLSVSTLESPQTTSPAPTETPSPTQAPASLVDDDPSRGPDNAPVTIVEFSDFQCPYCARSAIVVHQIIDTYGNKVRFVYRDFPLSSIHPNAQKAAEAAECADEQGKFWELHDIIFTNQNKMGVNDLKQFAKDLGMDSNNFDECLDSGKYEAEVKKDMQDGINAGVTSTPTFFINGEKIVGAKPFSDFQQVIDSKLT
ncbi:MAG: thioredoxin domain-containing protein [Candidatus Hydrothermarchaeales archaeon]